MVGVVVGECNGSIAFFMMDLLVGWCVVARLELMFLVVVCTRLAIFLFYLLALFYN